MAEIPDGLELTAFDENFYADPYAVYERLRHLDPVHKDKVGFYDSSWTISSHELVKSLLKDKRLSVDPTTIGIRRDPRADNPVTLKRPDMMGLDNPGHQRLRSLVQKAFTPSLVNNFAPRIDEIVTECLNGISERTFDVVSLFSKPIPTMTIAEFIGVDSRDHKDFKAWTDSLLLQGYPMPTSEQWDEIVAADASLRRYMGKVVQDRKEKPKDDLVSKLVEAQDGDETLLESEIIDMCCLLIGAGNFTTTDLISNCLFRLLERGKAQGYENGLKNDDIEAVVEEVLRFDSPVLAVRRFVTEDIIVAGNTIPQGSVLSLLTASANHDPSEFNDPDNFHLDHQGGDHLSFGRGIHHCLGAPLARLEACIAVKKFFTTFPQARLYSSKRSRRMDFRGFQSLTVATIPQS